MKALMVTCDDCGLSEGINLATLELHRKGIASSASVLTNFPATAHALDLFHATPALSVGAHLNLTDGFPLTNIPASAGLTGSDGRFRPIHDLLRYSLAPSRERLALIEQELKVQIEVLIQAGFTPQHLTTHLQFHLFTPLRQVILRLAARYRVSWVRPHRVRAVVLPFNILLRNGETSTSDRAASLVPTHIAVLKYWMHQSPEQLCATLARINGTVELVVHPDRAQDETFPPDVHYTPRERFAETRYLELFWPLLQALHVS